MAYSKHNFSDGSVLHASSLNEMDEQILANESAAASAASAASAAASAAAGKYSKPLGGIPAGDLTGEVQAAIAKAAAIGAVWTLKGTVASAGLLPGSGNTIGDVYYVSDESVGYVWLNDGSTDRWEQLGPTVNTSAFVKTTASGAQQITANSPTVLALKNAATLAAQQGKAYIKMVDHDGSALGYFGINDGKFVHIDDDGTTEHELVPKPAIVTTGTSITLADNTVYRMTDVTTLTITFPGSGSYHSHIRLTTAASGTVTITLPAGALFIGAVPSFGNGETWELDVEDGVVVAGKAVAAS